MIIARTNDNEIPGTPLQRTINIISYRNTLKSSSSSLMAHVVRLDVTSTGVPLPGSWLTERYPPVATFWIVQRLSPSCLSRRHRKFEHRGACQSGLLGGLCRETYFLVVAPIPIKAGTLVVVGESQDISCLFVSEAVY